MLIILISYRARGIQHIRREQLTITLNNFKSYFEINNMKYKVIISEQNNDNKFNRGFLLNVAFLEAEKNFNFSKQYLHMNVDCAFNLSRKYPLQLLDFDKGIIDLHKYHELPTLGPACIFDADSYKLINGFPNDLEGWGGEDWAIYNRIIKNNLNVIMLDGISNSGFIVEDTNIYWKNDASINNHNVMLALRDDFKYNGLNSIKYKLEGFGEFHDGDIVFHYLINND